jgi:hypothetical protein
MTIRIVERESGKRIRDIPPETTVHLTEEVNFFGKYSLYNLLDPRLSLFSLPKGQGYRVDIEDAPTLSFCVSPGNNRYIQTEKIVYIAT